MSGLQKNIKKMNRTKFFDYTIMILTIILVIAAFLLAFTNIPSNITLPTLFIVIILLYILTVTTTNSNR